MVDDYRGHPPCPKGGVADFGGDASLPSMEVHAQGLAMSIPFWIVQGRDDYLTSLEASDALHNHVRPLAI